MAITNGTYTAKASGECVLGESKKKGTPFLEVNFRITEGENKGGLVRWTGYFTEATSERTIEALQRMGWTGDDISEFADGKLHGLDKNDVAIVVELEEYDVLDKEDGTPTGEKRTSPRVQWVNKAGGYLSTAQAMSPQAAKSFGDRMRGLVMKAKEKSGSDSDAAEPPAKAPF